MPEKARPGTKAYYWEMEIALRERMEERCELTGRSLKEELTEAALHWLDQPPSLGAKARAAQLKKARSK